MQTFNTTTTKRSKCGKYMFLTAPQYRALTGGRAYTTRPLWLALDASGHPIKDGPRFVGGPTQVDAAEDLRRYNKRIAANAEDL